MANPADRNLLLGLLALQHDFVTREQLLDSLRAWLERSDDALGAVLEARGALTAPRRELLEARVREELAQHHANPTRSLVSPDQTPTLAQMTVPPLASRISVASVGSPANGAPRYRKIRAHAKGGLGEVFVALDEELHREVALKEIQARHADHVEFRERFVREALITGALEHPGIIPVHGLGHDDHGRPYYAMRFIRGESMQEAVHRFHEADRGPRDPGERELALRQLLTRFVVVCNAMAYAHARGIVHRDLKPANVMLGEYGETLVVDWGLAKPVGQAENAPLSAVPPSGSGSAPTQVGQAVGTPAFMPPEQARGEHDTVDGRSDVWALGATLYCVLTGQPPYQGAVLDQIIQATEARFPPARQVSPRVPAALEAVCARAMALRPEERYASAREMAADVERWLADEPVRALPEPWRDRARRWARRHRTLVASALVLLVTGVIGLVIGLGAVRLEQVRTAAQRDRAEEAEGIASARLAQALAAEKRATDHLAEAEANFKLARQVVDDSFGIARNDPLLNKPVLPDDLHRLKLLLLEKALPFYQQFRARRSNDPSLLRESWEQHTRVAYILAQLGRHDDALRHTREAEGFARQLVKARADDPGPRTDLAATLNTQALLLRGLGRREEARRNHAEAARLSRELARAQPTVPAHRADLAATLGNLGLLQGDLGELGEALASFSEAVSLRRGLLKEVPPADGLVHQEGLAAALTNLSLLQSDLGRRDVALAGLREAAELRRRLVEAQPTVPNYQADLADALNNLAALLKGLGQPGEALKAYTEAVTRGRALVQAQPGVTGFRADLASTLTNLGTLQRDLGQPAEARKALTESIGLTRELSRANPRLGRYREALAGALNNLGLALVDLGRPSESLQSYTEALGLRRDLAREQPEVPGYRIDVADTLNNLGALRRAGGQAAEAVRLHLEAVSLLRPLAREYPTVPEYREALAGAWSNLGVALQALGRRDEALRPAAEAARLWRALVRLEPTVPGYRADLAGAVNNLGALQADRGRAEMALLCFTEAIERGRALVQGKTGVVRYRVELCQALLNRAQLHRAGREEARAKADLDEVVLLLTGHAEGSAVAATLRLFAHEERARLLLDQGKPREALADWARALALAPAERRAAVRLGRADCLARAGQHEAAAAEAVAVSRQRPLAAETTFDAACVLAVSAAAAWRDAGLPLPVRERQADDRAREAVALLRGLRLAGHFRGELRTEPDLDFLRGRADFRALLAREK